MSKFFVTALALIALGCGNARELDCLDGCSDRQTEVRTELVQIQPELGDEQIVTLTAARTYSPSKFFNSTLLLPAGRYSLPTQLELVNGAAGTGWASVNVGGVLTCYQGNGANNSQPGTGFVLRGIRTDGKQCFESGLQLTNAAIVETTGESLLLLSVNGGGLSNHLQQKGTIIQLQIQAQIYTY